MVHIGRQRHRGGAQAGRSKPAATGGGTGSAAQACEFLSANYSQKMCAAVLDRARCPDRRRTVAICHGCQGHVGDGGLLAPARDEMRLRDYVVDPVRCQLFRGDLRSRTSALQVWCRQALLARPVVLQCSGSA